MVCRVVHEGEEGMNGGGGVLKSVGQSYRIPYYMSPFESTCIKYIVIVVTNSIHHYTHYTHSILIHIIHTTRNSLCPINTLDKHGMHCTSLCFCFFPSLFGHYINVKQLFLAPQLNCVCACVCVCVSLCRVYV